MDSRVERRRLGAAAGLSRISSDLVADLDFFDRKGEWTGRIRGLRVAALPARTARGASTASELHRIEWRAADLALLEVEREVDRFILVSDSESNAAWLAAELNKQAVEIRFCEKVEDLAPLVTLLRATGDRRFGFLLLAWADWSGEAGPEPDFQRDFRVGHWAEAIREHTQDASQIWIATRGLQPRGTDTEVDALGPHVAREIDTFASCAEMQQCRLFDARREIGDADFAWLASLVGRPGAERQFVMSSEGARVPRLVAVDEISAAAVAEGAPGSAPREAAGARNFRAIRTGREGRAAVALVACGEVELAPDELRVEVRAAAMSNFDVLAGLGLARRGADPDGADERGSLGLDFAGVVTAVGARVTDLAVGTRVAGIAGSGGFEGGAVARRIAVSRSRVAALPARLDFASAASLAWPGLVARHVLADVARVRPGERVLVVSAGGGIGLSLVGRARALGAEVHATASTPARRAALIEQGACVGEGSDFDVIVSSESGPALHARLAALAPGGRYVDLCPRERFEREELGALRLGANRAYLAVDCLAALDSDSKGIGARLDEMMAELDEGTLETIALTRFPVSESARALRFMTQNRHTGRVVLDLSEAATTLVEAGQAGEAALFADRRVVVSCANGSERGAAVRTALADWLRARGAAEVRESTAFDPAPRDAWFHTADEAFAGPDGLRHRLAAAHGIDRILISLREPVTGEPDRDRAWEARLWIDRLLLAGVRTDSGRTLSLSVDADATPASVVRALDGLWRTGVATDQRILLSPAEQSDRLERAPSPILSLLDAASARSEPTTFDRAGFLALSPPERRAALLRHVREELAGVLGLSVERRDELDPGLRLDALGLDSLMTMELFMGLGRGLELALAADWFTPGPTLAEIAQVLARRLEASLAGGAP